MSHPAKSHVCVEKGLEIGLYELSVIFVTACLKEKPNLGKELKMNRL
jgi:hypothetical protein